MKRPKSVDEYIDLVHQAVYEIDEFRSGLEYEPENAEMFGPFIEQLDAMVRQVYDDMVAGRYSNVELASFVTACAGDHMSLGEIVSLTRAMAAATHG